MTKPNHGGARKGAGRPAIDGERVTFKLDARQLAAVAELKRTRKESRSEVLRHLVDRALEIYGYRS